MLNQKTSAVALTYHHVNRDVSNFSQPCGNAWHKHGEFQSSLGHKEDVPQSQPCNVALLIYKLENCWSLVIWELLWLKAVRWWRNTILRVVSKCHFGACSVIVLNHLYRKCNTCNVLEQSPSSPKDLSNSPGSSVGWVGRQDQVVANSCYSKETPILSCFIY